MKTFLKPLSAPEETQYLQKYQEGDRDAWDVLIERNLRLVAHMVKKYQNVDEDPEDLISIGTIGLIKAISTFDPKKKIRLATYAARCIDNELLMFLRTRKKYSREVSLYEPIGTDKEGNEIHFMDVMESSCPDASELFIFQDEVQHLYKAIDSVLSEQEKKVIILRYGLFGEENLTQKRIAGRLGISRSYVSRIEKNAILKLRHCFSAT